MQTSAASNRIHPLVATAAVSVTLFSIAGIAAVTGLLPKSHSENAAAPQAVAADAPLAPGANLTAPAASLAPPAAVSAPVAAPAAGPIATAAPKPSVKLAVSDTEPAPRPVKKPAPVKRTPPPESTAANYSGTPNPPTTYQAPVAQVPAVCHDCGRVESVYAASQPAQPSGVGMVAGAVLGGVLGNQVGGGSGKKIATVAGAIGGGYAGNEVEKNTRASTTYQVRVRMEDGTVRTYSEPTNAWQVGDRVRVVNGALVQRG